MPEGPTEEMFMACFSIHLPENLQEVQGEAAGMAWHWLDTKVSLATFAGSQLLQRTSDCDIFHSSSSEEIANNGCLCKAAMHVLGAKRPSWRQCGVTFLMQFLSISGLCQEPTS
jgi:hypothetical protein